jgi:hypothetical protein
MLARTQHVRIVRCAALSMAILLGVLLIVAVILALGWPFTRGKLIRSLEHFSSSEVQVGGFHRIYFPCPGYAANRLIFSRRSGAGSIQLASIDQLECRASWTSVLSFTHLVKDMRIGGLRVEVPAAVPRPMDLYPKLKEEATITTLIADGAVIEIAPRYPTGPGLRFEFPILALGNIEKKNPVTFRTVVYNSKPHGYIEATGRFGPLQGNADQTPVSGSFEVSHLDLGDFRVIRGLVAGQGSFSGTLGHCEVQGTANIPDFEVTSSQHKVALAAGFHTVVHGRHGDISIVSTTAHWLGTTLQAHGRIGSTPGQQGKTTVLDIDSVQARAEDLLQLFVKADRPPLDGQITFQAEVAMPPDEKAFLQKVRLDGHFRISDAVLTNATSQNKTDKLSERARGKKVKGPDHLHSEAVISALGGNVQLRNGTAILSSLLFRVPGAVARGNGTYDLPTERIDLHGKLAMQASLSKAARGVKSVLLVPLDPFFKKEDAGAVIPVEISGTYSHPAFRISLRSKQQIPASGENRAMRARENSRHPRQQK